jgi:hypothetical protein
VLNAAEASLLTPAKRVALADDIRQGCAQVRHSIDLKGKPKGGRS